MGIHRFVLKKKVTMVHQFVLVFALGVSSVLGGIVIPTENCEWREESYGIWNQCYGNEVATGSCGSGAGKQCHDGLYTHGIYCCDLPEYAFTDCEEKTGDFGANIDCGKKPVGAECGSGSGADCHNAAHGVRCCDATYQGNPVVPVEEVCYWKYTPNWGERIFCNRNDEAIFGRCGSGRFEDCEGGNAVHGIKCCEITTEEVGA